MTFTALNGPLNSKALNGVSNHIVLELAIELTTPRASLFNQSVNEGEVPADFRIAYICPVPRGGGDPVEVCNYRSISLLSDLHKVFERLAFKYLFIHLRENNIHTSFQFGFTPGDSS